jgi:hypothetical protein
MIPYVRESTLIVPADLDPLVPAQWAATPIARRGAGWSRLGAAVLREAWGALRWPRASRVHRDAVAFFLEPSDDTAPLSFERACTFAGVEPEGIRRLVRARLEARR